MVNVIVVGDGGSCIVDPIHLHQVGAVLFDHIHKTIVGL